VVSGFGFALVAAPVLVAVTDPVTSVSILAVAGVFTSTVTLTAGRERPQVAGREATLLVLWALPGLVFGAWLVTRVPADAIRVAVGVLVLAALAQRRFAPAGTGRVPPARRPASRAAAGLASGTLSTSTGLSGPPLVLHLASAAPRVMRDTLAVVFVVLGVLTTATLLAAGELTVPTVTVALPVAVLAGGVLGHRIFDRLSPRAHGRIVTVLLVASAVTAIGAAVG
jgi:hypothetical protein